MQTIRLQVGQYCHKDQHRNTMSYCKPEDVSFVANHAGGSGGNGNTLRGNHFAANAAGRVSRYCQVRIYANLLGSGTLHAAEERIRRRIRTGQEYAQPAKNRREEGEESPSFRESKAHGGAHAREVHNISQAENHGNGADREN